MALPDFIIIGAQKSGTSWLGSCLRQRDDVFVHRGEIHYFNDDRNYNRGPGWYETHFSEARDDVLVGEKTPNYLPNCVSVGQPERIKDLLPDVKLVAIVRDPVERAISSYRHLRQRGRVSARMSIDSALHQMMNDGHWAIGFGYYYRHVLDYHRVFDPQRLLVLGYEADITQAPDAALASVEAHLGLDPGFDYKNLDRKVNVSSYSRALLLANRCLKSPRFRDLATRADRALKLPALDDRPSRATVDRLAALYETENERLFDLIGKRFEWTTASGSST
ncbi:MAG: sulfotransferase domain-containing protein [Actinomycetia bacterium]|nr:sulfotransferase domain-containing protein [Actinomycetes bacterium]MCP4960679.1 sulfotransferase domain-containing protein [Actinomycetes bacterium]